MGRINFLLLLAVLASALYLVHIQYESRRVFVEMEKAMAQSRNLEAEKQRLQVEKRAQATSLRVEKLAIEKLQMRTPTPAITQYITSPDSRPQEVEADRIAAPQLEPKGDVRAQ